MNEKEEGDENCVEGTPGTNRHGLPLFIGVKIISAEPMDLWDFQCDIKKMKEPDSENAPGYKVVYDDSYISWSPKKAFEDSYRRTDGISFGLAIEALKKGKKVARSGWNGKGMYLTLQSSYPVNGFLNADSVDGPIYAKPEGIEKIPPHKGGQMLPCILMKTAGYSHYWGEGYNDYVPWLASQTDMISDDWQIVE